MLQLITIMLQPQFCKVNKSNKHSIFVLCLLFIVKIKHMKTLKSIPVLILFLSFLVSCTNHSVETKKWKISFNSEKSEINLQKGSEFVIGGLYASYKLNGELKTTKDYTERKITTNKLNDEFGKGQSLVIVYSGDNLPRLTQHFYIYDENDYVLTEFFLENISADTISSNYMAPINLSKQNIIEPSNENRALFIPFDNDCWVRYKSHTLTFEELTSYEVSAVFNNETRKSILVGSIEHDNWKTAIKMTANGENALNSLVCYGGVADSLTRDSKQHGALSGKIIKSPKILLAVFDDWRDGLDKFGEANAKVAPPKKWDKAVPFGWNSWGVLQFNLTYAKAMEVSDFFKNNLQKKGFVNPDNTVYIGLDSGWNRFTEDELKAFVQKCRENGQIAGIYWTPFTDWGRNPEATVHNSETYKYKDIYVYANGKPQELDGAYAIDPTHPAIEERMKKTSDLFRRCGFEYVKMDFMTHAAMEGDKWYNPEIQTGIQAYNYGMQLLNNYFGDMYINLSISPIFPAQYAQSRRIACDAWNKIKDTEYTMNAVSYGWWIDKVYQYNDADHIVLRDATEGENRARVTSAVITGLYIAGDDFSNEGSAEGKERAIKYLTNPAINAIANGVSFRPIEGNGEKSENQFVRKENNGTYYVYLNYDENNIIVNIPLERIGLDKGKNYNAMELWKNEPIDIDKPLPVRSKDVMVVFIEE